MAAVAESILLVYYNHILLFIYLSHINNSIVRPRYPALSLTTATILQKKNTNTNCVKVLRAVVFFLGNYILCSIYKVKLKHFLTLHIQRARYLYKRGEKRLKSLNWTFYLPSLCTALKNHGW
jgi:hypothetical protein